MTSATSTPLWTALHPPPTQPLPRLPAGLSADVCVIGAGIAGLSVALSILQSGRRVVVLDRDGIGGGETLRTSAHLSSALDDRYSELERWHGEDGARLAAHSHQLAIDQVEQWVRAHAIECDFARVDGYLLRAPEDDSDVLEREFNAALRIGQPVIRVAHAPSAEQFGTALKFPQQARIEISRYLHGLAAAVQRAGGRIFGHAEAVEVHGGDAPRVVMEDGHEVRAGCIVVATNVPFHHRVTMHTKQAAYRTFVLAARVPVGEVADALYWDTADPYHYVRTQPVGQGGYEYLIVGGEDHKTGQPEQDIDRFARLERWARGFCPLLGPIEFRWTGQIIEPVDGMAFIGADPGERNVFMVTGDSGNGLTHGTLAGPLLAALTAGEEHPWTRLYDPSRKQLNASWLSENANVVLQYRDLLTGGDQSDIDGIARGQGAVLRRGLHRLATFRDEAGILQVFSARCPHLGCSVRWNGDESSWDCPCHGSRFDPHDGRVLNGPAASGLSRVCDEEFQADDQPQAGHPAASRSRETGERPGRSA